jgi:hypothetical protein
MKSTILSFLIFLGSIAFSFGQQLSNSEKIIQVYGQEWFDRMQSSNSSGLQVFDRYVENGFSVENFIDEKYNSFPVLDSIPLRSKTESSVSIEEFLMDYSSSDFNPLKYKFFPGNTTQIYKLQGVNKIIKILPQSSLLNH